MLKSEIHKTQIHQHKQTCQKKCKPICRFQYSKPLMRNTKYCHH